MTNIDKPPCGFEQLFENLTYFLTYAFFCHRNNLQIKCIIRTRRFDMINFICELFRWHIKLKFASIVESEKAVENH